MDAGTQVGAYRIVQQIGEGGMGTVWLAEHIALGRRAAVKVLHPMFTTRQEIVNRFFNEARAASAISDPGIVQIFDFGEHTDGSAYIVMELLEGEALDKRLERRGALSIADAVRIIRQVANALGAAHARGIVHRDIKPENIFLVRDTEVVGGERAKLLDFGIAKLVGDTTVKTQTSAVMGTPMYMSPEQCRGAGQVDERSDIYSLGCVLFTLVTGRPPFDAEGGGEIIAMHLREPAPGASSLMSGIPPALDELIERCLAKDPGARFATGAQLAAALDELRANPFGPTLPITPRSSNHAALKTTLSGASSSMELEAPRPRRRGLVIALLAIVALAIAAVVVVVSRTEKPSEQTLAVASGSVVDKKPAEPALPATEPAPATEAPTTEASSEPTPILADKPTTKPPRGATRKPGKKPSDPKINPRSDPKTIGTVSESKVEPETKAETKPIEPPPDPPPNPKPGSSLPAKIDRPMIATAVAGVKRLIVKCGTGFPGTEVKLSVTVAPDGTVATVTIKESPDPWLSGCVSARMKAARFPPTQTGGSFSHGFAF